MTWMVLWRDYCGCSPDAFTTSFAAARSALISAANCSGVLIAGTWPRLMMYLSRKPCR